MWSRAWLMLSISSRLWAQQTHTRVHHHGGTFEWGWQQQQQPTGHGSATVGHYYVKLPQSEQQVRYRADESGYQAQAQNYPDPAHLLAQAQNQQNTTQLLPQAQRGPVDIYLLHQQFPSPSIVNQQLADPYQNYFQFLPPLPNYYHQVYNVNTQHVQNNERKEGTYEILRENESSNALSRERPKELTYDPNSIVQVFKDSNCTHDEEKTDRIRQGTTTKLFAQNTKGLVSNNNINGNFGARQTERPVTYRGAVHFRVEPQRENARSERYYYTTDAPARETERYVDSTTARTTTEDERISRLVASTQDLISNEDLLKINHAAEKQVGVNSDDIIKPRSRFYLRAQETKYDIPRSRITVKAKIGNIVDSEIVHLENNESKEQVLDSNAQEYKFASPIVVQDSPYGDYKEQIVNNLVSTMVPYIENGYEIVGVRDSANETESSENEDDMVNVTPRPIGQKYLAPITVALRLLNANDTESFNYIDDHETSDSEIHPSTVEQPNNEKTVVEIQKSIPVSITHYNDVEVHQYLDEGRSNQKGPMDYMKTLYNKYVESINTKNGQNNVNDILHKYNAEKNYNNDDKYERNESQEQLDTSENIQTEVGVHPNDFGNDRKGYRDYYYGFREDGQKIIQPIIIEKEVPVTQFVDRYIEKQVPVHSPVEVPVDRPVAVPVPYEKIVERPYEVTRYVDKPFPVVVPRPYPVQVKVPYPVEQKVYVDRPVHVPYPIEKLVEKQIVHPFPVPTPVAVPVEVQVPVEKQVYVPIETPYAVPVEVEKPVPYEKIVTQQVPVPVPVEKKVPYPVPYETRVPVPYAVEKRVPYPVEKIVDRPITITKYVEKPIHIPVPQPVPVPVHFHHEVPVDRIVEKKVPYPVHVDRIVEKKVPVQVPYPVEKVVEKIVEKPVVVTKYVDKPYPVEKRVPYPVEKIVEKRVPYPVLVEKIVEKPRHVQSKVPYTFEKPYSIYNYAQGAYSQNYPQHLKYTVEQHKSGIPPPHIQNQQQYAQNMNEKLKEKQTKTTHWGNLYASSYQHINYTSENGDFNKSPRLTNYLNYLTNQNAQSSQYYGPPPIQNYVDEWPKNKDYFVELKLRRTDRQPRTEGLRIEYGGFKPPLIPSTEVDLDGIPVKKDGK